MNPKMTTMSSESGQDPSNGATANDYSPTYWRSAFSGSPTAIFVPPYIRFLQGQVALRKALNFLVVSRTVAKSGFAPLSDLLESLEDSPESKQAQTSFESLFAAALYVNLISEVEHFFVTCAATAIRLYPGKVGSETFRLADVLAVSSTDELVERAADRAMQALMYEKPADYLSGLCEILSVDKKHLVSIWPRFVEMKARRDLGVHNNWSANEIYLRKLKEIGFPDPPSIGSRLIPDFEYLDASIDTCDRLVGEMANLMAEKWLPKSGTATAAANLGRQPSSSQSSSAG
jgi:hypothetical protein